MAFCEPGGGLHTEHHLVVEFGDIRGADVCAGAAHAGGDVVEQVLDAGPSGDALAGLSSVVDRMTADARVPPSSDRYRGLARNVRSPG